MITSKFKKNIYTTNSIVVCHVVCSSFRQFLRLAMKKNKWTNSRFSQQYLFYFKKILIETIRKLNRGINNVNYINIWLTDEEQPQMNCIAHAL